MSIFTDFFSSAWGAVKHVFKADVEPPIKTFLELFAGDEGHLILTTALSVATELATGNFGAVSAKVFATVVSESEKLAAQDAARTLQQVQSALQIAKVAANVASPGDQQLVASLTTTSPAVA